MREREQRTANKFNIMETCQALENDLLKIDGVTKVDYDLDGFYDDMKQVIILTGYDIDIRLENYYEVRGNMVDKIKETCKKYDLKRTLDKIEDYGASLYFVFEYTEDSKHWNK